MKISKNIFTYTVPVLLAAGLAVSVVWGRAQKARADGLNEVAEKYVSTCVSACARCGSELKDTVYDMSVSLEKLRALSSRSQRVLALEDIVRGSAEAEKLLTRLPRSQVENMGLEAFLVRIGDYARSLSRRLLAGEELDQTDEEQLESLIDAVTGLASRLEEMVLNGEMPVGTEEFDYYDTDGESEDPEYPTLLYDGPFSESNETAEPLGLVGEEGTSEDAKRRAEELLGVSLEPAGETEGRIPTYDFTGEGFDVSITKTGLFVLFVMGAPSGDGNGMPSEEEYGEFVDKGKVFLSLAGYDGMEPTYSECTGGTVLISFAWSADGVTVYNDLVKVWLDRETGGIVGLDARSYIFSHRERDIPEPKLTKDEARAAVSQRMEIGSSRMALIPVSSQREELCYEFRGKCGEREYLVYINAVTGTEEQVFIIVSDENGERAI